MMWVILFSLSSGHSDSSVMFNKRRLDREGKKRDEGCQAFVLWKNMDSSFWWIFPHLCLFALQNRKNNQKHGSSMTPAPLTWAVSLLNQCTVLLPAEERGSPERGDWRTSAKTLDSVGWLPRGLRTESGRVLQVYTGPENPTGDFRGKSDTIALAGQFQSYLHPALNFLLNSFVSFLPHHNP